MSGFVCFMNVFVYRMIAVDSYAMYSKHIAWYHNIIMEKK